MGNSRRVLVGVEIPQIGRREHFGQRLAVHRDAFGGGGEPGRRARSAIAVQLEPARVGLALRVAGRVAEGQQVQLTLAGDQRQRMIAGHPGDRLGRVVHRHCGTGGAPLAVPVDAAAMHVGQQRVENVAPAVALPVHQKGGAGEPVAQLATLVGRHWQRLSRAYV